MSCINNWRTCLIPILALGVAGCSPTIALPTPEELQVQQITSAPGAQLQLSWKLIVRVDGYLLHYGEGAAAPSPLAGTGLALVPWPEGCGDLDAGATSTISTDLQLPDARTGDSATVDSATMDQAPADQAAADQAAVDQTTVDQAALDQAAVDQAAVDQGPPDTGPPDAAPPGADSANAPPGIDSPVRIPVSWCLDREDTFKDAGKIPVHTPGTRPRVRLRNVVLGRTYHFAVQAFRKGSTSAPSATVSITIQHKPGSTK